MLNKATTEVHSLPGDEGLLLSGLSDYLSRPGSAQLGLCPAGVPVPNLQSLYQ